MHRTASRLLLRRRPLYARLLLAHAVSVFGDWYTYAAMNVLAFRLAHGQALPVGTVLLLSFLPSTLFGLVAGPLADRWHRGRMLVACDLFRAGVVTAAFFADTLPELYAASFLLGLGTALFTPAQRAALPATVAPDELTAANALAESAEALMRMLGPAAAYALIERAGVRPAFLVDAATFLASALLLLPLARAVGAAPGRPRTAGLVDDLRAGLRYHRQHGLVWGLLVLQTVLVLGAWGFNALLVVITERHFRRSDAEFGLIMSIMAAGLTLGNLALAHLAGRVERRHLIAWSYAGTGLLVWSVLAVPHLEAALPLFLLLGFLNAGYVATHVAWLQEVVPPHLLGRVFAARYVVMNAAVALTTVGSTWAADALGLYPTVLVLGALIAACAVLTYALPGLRPARATQGLAGAGDPAG